MSIEIPSFKVLSKFYCKSIDSLFAGPCAQGVWDPVIIPRPMSRAVLFVPSTLSWASLGPLDPKVCSLAAGRRLVGGSLVDCRYGSRPFVHSSGFTLRFAFGWRANGPRPPTYPPYPPTYGFMAQFFTTCIIFSYFLKKASLNIPYTRVIYRTLE